MKIWAEFDEDGFPVGFYPEEIFPEGDPKIPENSVLITEEQWSDFLLNPGERQWQDGEVVTYAPPPLSKEAPTRDLVAEIDQMAARLAELEALVEP